MEVKVLGHLQRSKTARRGRKILATLLNLKRLGIGLQLCMHRGFAPRAVY